MPPFSKEVKGKRGRNLATALNSKLSLVPGVGKKTAARLLPLSGPVLARGAAVTLLTDLPIPPEIGMTDRPSRSPP